MVYVYIHVNKYVCVCVCTPLFRSICFVSIPRCVLDSTCSCKTEKNKQFPQSFFC